MAGEGDEKNRGYGRMAFDAFLAIVMLWGGYTINKWDDEMRSVRADTEKARIEQAAIRKEISERGERLPLEYVRKDEYRLELREVKDLLREINNKLDTKADRQARTQVVPGSWRDGRDINR